MEGAPLDVLELGQENSLDTQCKCKHTHTGYTLHSAHKIEQGHNYKQSSF